MSWFSPRRKQKGALPSSLHLSDGSHPSPGLELLWATLKKNPPGAILDLGASSTENVRFLSSFSDNISIVDLFRGARADGGARASAFSFETKVLESIPDTERTFDVLFVWDLLHYFDRPTFAKVQERLAAVCRRRAIVYLLAANHAQVPLTPIRFKLESQDSLHYSVPEGERSTASRLVTREVEIRMDQFSPWRLFQLRNGLQEFLFRYEPAEESSPPEQAPTVATPDSEEPLQAPEPPKAEEQPPKESSSRRGKKRFRGRGAR